MLVTGERRRIAIPQVIADATSSQVHLSQSVGIRVTFLTIHAYIALIAPMSLYEAHTLHKHTTTTTTWVINGTIVWLYKISYQLNNALGSIKLTIFFCGIDCELL